MTERLAPEIFRLPIEKIRAGYKTDVYFNRTKTILTLDKHNPDVTMQLFQKVDGAIVCGVDHALAILHAGTGYYENPQAAQVLFDRYLDLEKKSYTSWLNIGQNDWDTYAKDVGKPLFETSQELNRLWVNTFNDLSIGALRDGDQVGARETVMLFEGDLKDFVHLETLYLGALTDGTCVATNTKKLVEAADDTPVLMFGARHRSHESQAGDGYAAYIGGVRSVSTHEQGEYWGSQGTGTIPHALIAAYDGNTVLATLKFDEHINGQDGKVNVVSLVDFDNDSVNTSLAVANGLNGKLWGVRLDTSENMIDRSLWEEIQHRNRGADSDTKGVNPRLVHLVREALDREGFSQVKIVVSGGFTADKIARFKKDQVPVDVFGVGSALFEGSGGRYDYTADVVRPVVKTGREFKPNSRLETLDNIAYATVR